MNPLLPALRAKAGALPAEPGVYIMRDAAKRIIYIGKAKQLRARVGSYFRAVEKHPEKTYRLVRNIDDFDFVVTSSEFEALVLEASLIKLHKPKYNIKLTDDKGFHYIHIGPGAYPRITAEKQKLSDGGKSLGPYTSSQPVRQIVEDANKAFMLPTCRRKFPQDFRKARPCLSFHIKQCMGVCRGKIAEDEYAEIIRQCLEFIRGGGQSSIAMMAAQMQEASENLDFERAAAIRDRIRSITRIMEDQSVIFTKEDNQDVIALARDAGKCSAVILKIREQRLVDKQDFDLGDITSLEAARGEFILSYYDSQNEAPKIISLDGQCEDSELISRFLTEKKGHKVQIHVPVRGEKLRLVKMAGTNAAQLLAQKSQRTGRELSALDELARLLGLESPPAYIEAYDISNMGTEAVVGGMVVFRDGRPLKSAYRKFNIKTVSGADDYASMREVLSRRLSRYAEEKDTSEGFGRLPDLILLDGGKGHVGTVEPLVREMGHSIPVFGMVKDDRHRTRAIAGDGGEIAVSSARSAFTLISSIQEEAHRFAVSHMRSKRSKSAFALSLETVEGIGEKRARALFKHFKTQAAMKNASEEELAAVPGMTKAAARAVYIRLNSKQ
ncbi:MAG: excinuclease ABC subunit UvrC [Oscillospiraceae bacterium]|nr:excinuclease ABC subunit UvrC [Oscillospiraceae bacterium]